MQEIIRHIETLFTNYKGHPADSIEVLPPSGSDRRYFRIYSGNESFIATHNSNVRENSTFFAFSSTFATAGCPVPAILAFSEDQTIYIQSDLGKTSLLNELELHGHNDHTYNLFQQSLRQLAHLQINGGKNINYDLCLTAKEFGKQAILSDLLYFKYYFLDTLKTPYDKQALLDDFDALSTYLTHTQHKHFMFRDFQSRNVQVKEGQVFFIDYQGGMKGALQYDVASLLWQAKADLSEGWKNSLLEYYMDCVDDILEQPIDRSVFISQYNGYVLIRLLQVLGAYGFRGLFERKAHFLSSIPLALHNMKWFINNKRVGIILPEFQRMLHILVSDEIIQRFESIRATDNTPLVISVNSFSYKKGLPQDNSDNGGGFIFDCRGILNPGRFEQYKSSTGRDKNVIDFLEQRTKMTDFLNSVFDVVDISVENYIQRDFENLMISFGCTGGQHRSVYAAEQTARHLRNKYGVKVILHHIVQEAKNWIN